MSADLHAKATVKLGAIREMGYGDLTLSPDMLVWTRRKGILDWLLFRITALHWLRPRVAIRRVDIKAITLHEEPTRAWIAVDAGRERYSLRIGEGPYPQLKNNKETTRSWYELLERDETRGA